MQFEQLIKDSINQLGVGAIHQDDENSYLISFKSVAIQTEYQPDSGTLKLASHVGLLDEEYGHGLTPFLLRVDPDNLPVGTLAVDSANSIVLVREDRFDVFDEFSFSSLLANFCMLAEAWSEAVVEYNSALETNKS